MILARLAALALASTMMMGSAFAGGEGPIRSVTLSSGGLAEVVREATVVGDATVDMEVPLDQVDDVLKSLVVLDPVGAVKSVSLDGPAPVDETFRSLPFGPTDLGNLPALLSSLQGAEVVVTSSGKTARGSVLGIETRDRGDGEMAPILSLMDGEGRISTLRMHHDVTAEFTDPAIRKKVADAVRVAGRGKADGSRVVSVAVEGDGGREIGLSYVVAAPVWKAAYRVVTGDAGKAKLQAWAVLENASGEDWNGVTVALSTGKPVTLKQRLHQRYWRERQEIPVAGSGRTAPEPDGGMLAQAANAPAAPRASRAMGFAADQMAEAAPMAGGMTSVANIASASDTGTVSEGDISAKYTLPGTYDLANGATLSVPIADVEIPAEMVSVYRGGQGDPHPVAAVMLENATEASLPPGILTVYDGRDGYVGDARLLGLPAGDSRLASFATDSKVQVVETATSRGDTVSVKAVDGLLHVTVKDRRVTAYDVSGAGDGERTVVIEHPKMPGWEFASEWGDGDTATHHRLKVKVAAGSRVTVSASQEIVRDEAYALADADPAFLFSLAGKASPDVKKAIEELAAAQAERTAWTMKLETASQSIEDLERTQSRIRDNIASLPDGSDVKEQYLTKLAEAEVRIEALEAERGNARQALRTAEEKVGRAIRSF